ISFLEEPAGYFSNRWLSTILIDPKISEASSEKIRLHLEKDNIESRPLWKPMHLQPVFKDSLYYGSGVSEELFGNGLCIPSGSNLTKTDLDRVISSIQELFQ